MITWNYIAGFFDGEGSITDNGKGYRITIPQTNFIVLQQILHFTKVGQIIKVTKRKSHWKDSWVYYIASQSDIQSFLKYISPHLVIKRAESQRVLQKLNYIVTKQKAHSRLIAQRIKSAKSLRKMGMSYREIGKELNIDWGFARRIILGVR
jgi:DNA-binding transcriptional regulator WhiA